MATRLIALCIILLAVVETNAQTILDNMSFSVRSHVNVRQNNGYNSKSEVYEKYSIEQNRAFIDYKNKVQSDESNHSKGSTRFGQIYYDLNRHEAIHVDTTSQYICKATSIHEILKIFEFKAPEDDEFKGLIVGPARLIFLTSKYRDRMQLVTPEIPKTTRNMPSFQYTFTLGASSIGLRTIFSVFYGVSPLDRNQPSIPIQIIIELPHDTTVVIDYTEVELSHSESEEFATEQEVINGKTILDEFTLDFRADCRNALADKKVDLFSGVPKRFSFRADLDDPVGGTENPYSALVSFDADFNMMRLDTFGEGGENYGRTLMNFKLGRLHYGPKPKVAQDMAQRSRHVGKESCTAAWIESDGRETPQFGRILASSDEFIYLGEAKVRGMSALVYEAINGKLPVWLDLPFVKFIDKANQRLQVHQDIKEDGSNLRTLVYMREEPTTGDVRPVPILIQLFTMPTNSDKPVRKRSIPVHNFIWHVDDPIEQFSLHNICESSLRYRIKIEMLLESEKPFKGLELAHTRNLAVIQPIFKRSDLPPSAIHNVQSRLLKSNPNAQKSNGILISFLVSNYLEHFGKIEYIGKGFLDSPNGGQYVSRIIGRSIQDCYLEIVHKFQKASIGFNYEDSLCIIDRATDSGFEQSQDGPLDLYHITRFETKYHETENWINNNGFRGSLGLMDMKFNVHLDQHSSMEFKPKRVEVKNERDSQELNPTDIGRIDGFGLVESNKTGSQRIGSANSIEKCRAACTSDFHCESFSICIRRGELQCIKSKASFHSKESIESLKKGQFDVRQLVKYSTCNLYNKKWINYFGEPYRVRSNAIGFYRAYAVDNPEQCAEVCFKKDLNLLANMEIVSPSGHIEPYEFYKKFCRFFSYKERRDSTLTANDEKLIQSRIIGKKSFDDVKAYCFLEDHPPDDHEKEEFEAAGLDGNSYKTFSGPIERYEFYYLSFYEANYGVSLKGSPMTKEQQVAFELREHASKSQMEIRENFINAGNNYQQELSFERELCASICFRSVHGPCDSFDFAIETWGGIHVNRCYINSISSKVAIDKGHTDLVSKGNRSVQVWHYEPLPGLLRPVDWSKDVGANDWNNDADTIESSSFKQTQPSSSHFLGSFLGIILGLLIGIGIGLKVTQDNSIISDKRALVDEPSAGRFELAKKNGIES